MANVEVRNLVSMMEFPREGVFSKVVAKTPGSNHTLMCLAAGSDISEHTSTREAAVTVLKGKGTFYIDGKPVPMEPGVFIFMPKDTPHSLSAEEDLAILLSLAAPAQG